MDILVPQSSSTTGFGFLLFIVCSGGFFQSTWVSAIKRELEKSSVGSEPSFVDHIDNTTVAVGREATLSCQVKDLANYKVGWIKAGDQTILTLHKRVITHNSRIHVTHDEHRTWNLHIRHVTETDKGCYMCQINTAIMKKQLGCIDVLVPPDIIFEKTSSDVTVTEDQNTTLVCRATGTPEPTIMWRREDGETFTIRDGRGKQRLDKFFGEKLLLHRISRKDMGVFMCIAQNSVPPAVSVRVSLNVNFAPSVKVENQLVGCPHGESIEIQCLIEAYPHSVNYWTKAAEDTEGEILYNSSSNFEVREIRISSYKVRLTLRIHRVNRNDFEIYTCISSNSLGQDQGTIRLYEIEKVPEKKLRESSSESPGHASSSPSLRPGYSGLSTESPSPLENQDNDKGSSSLSSSSSNAESKILDAIFEKSQNSNTQRKQFYANEGFSLVSQFITLTVSIICFFLR